MRVRTLTLQGNGYELIHEEGHRVKSPKPREKTLPIFLGFGVGGKQRRDSTC